MMNAIDSKNASPAQSLSSATPTAVEAARNGAPGDVSAASAVAPTQSEAPAAPPTRPYRKWLLWAAAVAMAALGVYFAVPWVDAAMNTESTDDAYVNGHVTLLAPRVPGKVARVLVDDNDRVKKGDLLVQLDKEPFEVQVALKRAAVRVAEKNLAAAEAQARTMTAQLRGLRWKVEYAAEQIRSQVALLRAQVADLRSKEADLAHARGDYERGLQMVPRGAISHEEFDLRKQRFRSADAAAIRARETGPARATWRSTRARLCSRRDG